MAGPLRVALTGGIATGKSHCLAAFAALGAAVIDADAVAREVVEPGTPGLASVRRRFGVDMVTPDGRLDRERLGDIVFRDPEARQDLESIVHPLVYERLERWFETLRTAVGIAEIPLLYETGRADAFDRVVVAACSREEQKRRAMARDRLTEAEADQRLAAQMPIEEKMRLADFVVDTSGAAAETERHVADVWEELRVKNRSGGFSRRP